jgi:hypothetical protein
MQEHLGAFDACKIGGGGVGYHAWNIYIGKRGKGTNKGPSRAYISSILHDVGIVLKRKI